MLGNFCRAVGFFVLLGLLCCWVLLWVLLSFGGFVGSVGFVVSVGLLCLFVFYKGG